MLYSLAHLHDLRRTEMAIALERYGHILAGAEILEIAAGSGLKLTLLRVVARSVQGVDLPDSNHRGSCVADVVDYGGVTLPFATVPSMSSSHRTPWNTMEHMLDEARMHREMRRVLRNPAASPSMSSPAIPGGYGPWPTIIRPAPCCWQVPDARQRAA